MLAALPRAGQAQARLVLKLAGRYLPLRGVGKVAFLQSLDVARAAARRIGALLAADGVIAEPDDVFYLTAPEVLGAPPAGARDLVAERRAIREGYRKLRLPTTWTGNPSYELIDDAPDLQFRGQDFPGVGFHLDVGTEARIGRHGKSR